MIIIFDLTDELLEPDLCLRDGPLHKYVKLRDAYLINQVLVLFYPPVRKAKSLIEIELYRYIFDTFELFVQTSQKRLTDTVCPCIPA